MFEKISIHIPRQFVPTELNPGEWPSLEPLFDQLEQQLTDASDAAQLEQAILNWEELSAALAEEGSKRYIAMTCQTEDKAAETASSSSSRKSNRRKNSVISDWPRR